MYFLKVTFVLQRFFTLKAEHFKKRGTKKYRALFFVSLNVEFLFVAKIWTAAGCNEGFSCVTVRDVHSSDI